MAFDNSNFARFNAIMNSRTEIGIQHVGTEVKLMISGNPLYGYYDERLKANKDIYSLNANKATVLDSPWFTETLNKAIALEEAGSHDDARKVFDELMNKAQMTFSIINRGSAEQFVKNQQVIGTVALVNVDDLGADGKPTGTQHTAVTFNKAYAPVIKAAPKSGRTWEVKAAS